MRDKLTSLVWMTSAGHCTSVSEMNQTPPGKTTVSKGVSSPITYHSQLFLHVPFPTSPMSVYFFSKLSGVVVGLEVEVAICSLAICACLKGEQCV